MHKVSMVSLAAIIFSLICCSGFSALMPFRMAFIVLFASCMSYGMLRRLKISINRSPVLGAYFLFLVYLAVSVVYSYQKIETLKFLIVYIAGATMILFPTKEKFHIKCMNAIEWLCKIVAGSILVQIFIPNLYSSYLYFLILGGASAKSRLAGEVSSHIYSGIVGEKGEAAFLMVVAVTIVLAKCAGEKTISRKNLIWLVVYFAAMLLPAKRMLFAVGVLIVMLYIMFWTQGSKKLIAFGGAGVLGSLAYIVVSMIPSMNTLLLRFTSFANDDTANGRIYLWEHAIKMFEEKKVFGYGYGSYNTYASKKGVLLSKSGEWVSHAHNIYYQMLGEIGLFGTMIFALVCIATMYMFYRLYKKRQQMAVQDRSLMFFGVNMIVLTLVYGLTGNVIYYTNQIMFFFWGISISAYLYSKMRNGKIEV